MSLIVLGGGMLLIGVLSIWQGYIIRTTVRVEGTLDYIGPDGYLMGVGGMMILMAVLVLTKALRDRSFASEHPAPLGMNGDDLPNTRSVMQYVVLLVLVLYVASLRYLGYPLATLIAFSVLFWCMGIRRLHLTALAAVIATTAFYFIFVYFADMPLPRGMLGLR